MHKNLVLLFIPFFFTFILNITFDFFDFRNYKEINSVARIYIAPINIHKNYQLTNYSHNFLNYKDKIQNMASTNLNLASTTMKVLSNKIQKKIVDDYDSSAINRKYSEKFIDQDTYTYSKPIYSFEKKLEKNVVKKPIKKTEYSVLLTSTDWRKNISQKKTKFIETVLPLISFENQKILIERKRLIEIKNYLEEQKTLMQNDFFYLNKMVKKYQIKSRNKHKIDLVNELLFSVDVIPNSIVLAQAVNESGWGTSRFAREYNALFGQYTYDINNGVVPYEREKGKKHLIRNFSSIDKSVESYFRNINTHYAYQRFREVRSQIHKSDLNKNIKLLTQTLNVYAEDEAYVDTINSIIDSNNFFQFDLLNQLFINS